jgi:hypothetical protein
VFKEGGDQLLFINTSATALLHLSAHQSLGEGEETKKYSTFSFNFTNGILQALSYCITSYIMTNILVSKSILGYLENMSSLDHSSSHYGILIKNKISQKMCFVSAYVK